MNDTNVGAVEPLDNLANTDVGPEEWIKRGDNYLEGEEKEWGNAGRSYGKAIRLLEAQLPEPLRRGHGQSKKWDLLRCKIHQLVDRLRRGYILREEDSQLEELKDTLLEVHLKDLGANIEVRRLKSGMTSHDMGTQLRTLILDTEVRLRCYRIRNQKHLWNRLESEFDEWERTSLSGGRDYEAAEFNYAMMGARQARMKAERKWGAYAKLTVADSLVGFGHRLGRGLTWIAVVVIIFSLFYYAGYHDLGLGSQGEQSPTNLTTLAARYKHSLFISFAVLFLPRFELNPTSYFMQAVAGVNGFLSYLVNVGLIALLVNRLAGRRKW